MPAGPEAADARVAQRLDHIRRIAWWMDEGLRIPGTRIRIGLDPIIGLIPGLGDAAGAIVSGLIVLEALRSGANGYTALRMSGNIALDALLGAVPLVGDLFDAGWKANTRNLKLLERHLAAGPAARRSDRRVVFLVAGLIGLIGVSLTVGGVLLVRWILSLR